ncbi:MAG: hypothetical protein ABII96_08895, partial [Candidatus Zixiibacteriota bacterium]
MRRASELLTVKVKGRGILVQKSDFLLESLAQLIIFCSEGNIGSQTYTKYMLTQVTEKQKKKEL